MVWQDHIQGIFIAESFYKSSANLIFYARYSSRSKKIKGAAVMTDRNANFLVVVVTDIHEVGDMHGQSQGVPCRSLGVTTAPFEATQL